MAKSLNKVFLIGRIVKKPMAKEFRGIKMTVFTVATGDTPTDTQHHKIVAYGKLSEFAVQSLDYGSPVHLEGEIKYRKWKDNAGIEQSSTEIICKNFINLVTREELESQRASRVTSHYDGLI